MSIKSRIGVVMLLLLLPLLAACGQAPAVGTASLPEATTRGVDNAGRGLEVGQEAPDFVIQYPDGTRKMLADWRGQPLVINFWATWCAPCKAEMPEFVRAFERHQEDGLVVLGVNAQETAQQAQQFVDQFGMTFPVLLDSRGEIQELFLVRGLPTTLFIDRDGRIVLRWAGLLTGELLEEHLGEILPADSG